MSLKKLLSIIGISFAALVLIGGIAIVIISPDIRNGLSETVKGTITDTKLVIGGIFNKNASEDPDYTEGIDPEEEPNSDELTEVPDDFTDEPTDEPTDELEPRIPDNLKIYLPDTLGDFVVAIDSNEALIINGGDPSDADLVRQTLTELGVTKIKYIIGTNWHNTSVGGIPKILSYLPSEYILIANNVTGHENTKPLMDFLTNNHLTYTSPRDSGTYRLGKSRIRLITTHYGGSYIVEIENGDNTFVFTGTTTKIEEKALRKLPQNVDVYAITQGDETYVFPSDVVERVKPKNVILNDHPGIDPTPILTELDGRDSRVYQQSKMKNIVISSNGVDIEIKDSTTDQTNTPTEDSTEEDSSEDSDEG